MNRKITCAIVDDNPFVIKEITKHLEKFATVEVVHTATDPLVAQHFLSGHPVDLLLLDIEMPGMSGLELVQSLLHKPKVIFVTGHMQYAVDSFDLDAVDYLIKPIPFDRFAKAMNRLSLLMKMEKLYQNSLQVKNDYLHVRDTRFKVLEPLYFDEIVYMEARKNYVDIHLLHRKLSVRMKLGELKAELPKQLFIQPHRSFIVARKMIRDATRDKIYLKGLDVIIPVSRKLNEGFL